MDWEAHRIGAVVVNVYLTYHLVVDLFSLMVTLSIARYYRLRKFADDCRSKASGPTGHK